MNQCEIVVTNFEVRVAVSALIFFSELGRAVVRDSGPGQLWWCVGIVGNFLGHCGNFGGYCGKTGTMGGKLGKQHTYVVSGEVGAYISLYFLRFLFIFRKKRVD